MELPITVVVTLPLFAEFVREVGRENVEVSSLIPAGADPHSYELTTEDIQRIKTADFVFVNGLGLDPEIQELVEANRTEDAKVVPFAPNVRSPSGPGAGNPELTAEEAGDNPHLWLDPILGRTYAEIVADTFQIYDGVNTDFYAANFRSYGDEVLALLEETSAKLASIPAERRKIFTYHDSLEMFAQRFDLQVAGFAVPDPESGPTALEITEMVQAVQAAGLPAIFAESGFNRATMDEIGSKANVRVCSLYSDMPDDDEPTYLEMMRFNAESILSCLGG